jgi:hypothetical protein
MNDVGMTLFLNGQWIASRAGTTTTHVAGAELAIGDICSPSGTVPFTDGNEGYMDGYLDDVRFYNRALSTNEVRQLYLFELSKVPLITAQPRNQVGYWGKSVTFTVDATGVAPLSYQWLKNTLPIDGATESALVLTNLQMGDAGNYSVVITNALGSTTSSNAFLTMNPAGVSLALYSGITIDGVVGLTYGIQHSTDLSNTNNWHGLANVTLSAASMLWFDLVPANQPQRYYRVVPGPITIP